MILDFAAADASVKLDDFPAELKPDDAIVKAGLSDTVRESYVKFRVKSWRNEAPVCHMSYIDTLLLF